ncbi:unnamed protein product [Brassica oleracea var. botrytis]|uniref:(rape) hypothetical protein n=1 Tax=Brassica napus TaxID=3708 RepID=A0A816KER5_BRANA|nr:unnamed protein product [Brassica napus]
MIIMECPGLLRVMVPKLSTPTGKQKTKSVVNTPGLRKHLYSLRLGYVMDVSEEVNKVPTPSYADIDIRDVTEDANVVSPRLYRTDAIESTFKEQTPIPDAPLPKLSKMTNMLMSRGVNKTLTCTTQE